MFTITLTFDAADADVAVDLENAITAFAPYMVDNFTASTTVSE